MEFRTEIKISPNLIKLGRDLEAGIQAGLLRAAGAVEAAAVQEAPKATGNLANAIRKNIEASRAVIKSTAPYSIFVHQGTGLFGPHKTRIVPKEKKALAFMVGGNKVVVRSVKGSKANPFMQRAFKKMEPRLAGLFSGAIEEFLNKR
jgi:HK97 gp10 family phage protein